MSFSNQGCDEDAIPPQGVGMTRSDVTENTVGTVISYKCDENLFIGAQANEVS